MAKQTTVVLVDDLDGGQADETIEFAFEGRQYEVDLSKANAETLREGLAPFLAAARRTSTNGRTRRAVTAPRPPADREQNQAIREWARGEGMEVNERGRIPTKVLEAFQKAH